MMSSRRSGSEPAEAAAAAAVAVASESAAFDRLHPLIRRWVWRRGWQRLRSAQVAAVAPILSGERDVIVSAATAAGKTEAAFLPICSTLLEPTARHGVEVLYLSPLKALINDQTGRLEELCAEFDVAIHRWQGDVPDSRKLRVRRAPSGILLITPESLESLFVRDGSAVGALLGGLRYVVVDELHAFIGTERGAQLQSLLHRVELVVGRRIPRIALSATLGELSLAAEFLRPGAGAETELIEDTDFGQELRLAIFGFENSPRADARARIAGHLFSVLRGTDSLVFANSRYDVEIYCDRLTTKAERAGLPNQFFAHHGNLSRELREQVEARLRGSEQAITAVCSSTLEMGIDIGDMESVAQIGAPQSVAALRQRLGRSGRRGGPAVLRLYAAETEITDKTAPADTVRAELVQCIAAVRLLLDGWIEPPATNALHLSTLVQQLLSLIAQHGGVTAASAYATLCGHGPFHRVTRAMFATLLRAIAAEELIYQSSDGTLLLDVAGERIVNHYSFFAAFSTPDEYRLVASGETLGTVPVDYPVVPGMLLIFAGRRWRVLSVDDRHKVIDLTRSQTGRPPGFVGAGPVVHHRIRAEMYAVYRELDLPPYLNPNARELLREGRDNFTRLGLAETTVVAAGNDTVLFPWVGDRTMGTLAALFTAGGVEASNEGIALTITGLPPPALAAELAVLLPGGPPNPLELAALVRNKAAAKYDHYLGEELLNTDYAAKQLDPVGAWHVLERVARELGASD